MLPPAVSVVVPVFNAATTLVPLVARLRVVLERTAAERELILVDDGSRDGSWPVIEALAAQEAWITGIQLERNVGQHAALVCGVRRARLPWVVTLDDDLQHPPEQLPQLFTALGAGVDLVYGSSAVPDQGRVRRWAARGVRRLLISALGPDAARGASAMRCFRRTLVERFADQQHGPACLDLWLAPAPERIRLVPIEFEPRRVQASGYSLGKLLTLVRALLHGVPAAAPPRKRANVESRHGGGLYVIRRMTLGTSPAESAGDASETD